MQHIWYPIVDIENCYIDIRKLIASIVQIKPNIMMILQVKPCKSYCMAIAEQCFSHLTAIANDWENFAKMTSDSMDKLDKFAKVYEDALTQSINKIVEKLRDHDTADMVRKS